MSWDSRCVERRPEVRALARTGQSVALKEGEEVRSYLLLATSCDGTLALWDANVRITQARANSPVEWHAWQYSARRIAK